MPCDCSRCRQHLRVLGLSAVAPSKEEIHQAYLEAAKLWHPDQVEEYPSLRAQAEEQFKLIQVAYRELTEHCDSPGGESSVGASPADSAYRAAPADSVFRAAPVVEAPAISFDGAPGCLVAPNFTDAAKEAFERHLGRQDSPLAIIDLSQAHNGSFSQFLLLSRSGIMVRDGRNIVSVVWYADLGAVDLIDRSRPGKSTWQKFVGKIGGLPEGYVLQICRNNGALFYSLSSETSDAVKSTLHSFLLRKKLEAQS
jgi:hypothetical protein